MFGREPEKLPMRADVSDYLSKVMSIRAIIPETITSERSTEKLFLILQSLQIGMLNVLLTSLDYEKNKLNDKVRTLMRLSSVYPSNKLIQSIANQILPKNISPVTLPYEVSSPSMAFVSSKFKLKYLNETFLLIIKPNERNIKTLKEKIGHELKLAPSSIMKIYKESSKDGAKVQVKSDANVVRLSLKETIFVDVNTE